jgi:hypothetical protein
VESHSVGQIPEGATFSPGGSHVAVTIQNGSNKPKSHQSYNHGVVMVYGPRLIADVDVLDSHMLRSTGSEASQRLDLEHVSP